MQPVHNPFLRGISSNIFFNQENLESRQRASNSLVEEINWYQKPILTVIEEGVYGNSLQEIVQLLSLQIGTRRKLHYLDLRGVGFVDPFVLKEGLSQILSENAIVDVELEVNCLQERDLEYVERRIFEYREFFEWQENRYFHLKILNSPITEYFSEISDFLSEITFENCPNLRFADFESTPIVTCRSCESLTTAQSQAFGKVFFINCPSITQVSFPRAQSALLENCPLLRALHLPKACVVEIDFCESLEEANFLEAEKVELRNCLVLTQVNLPKATTVAFESCTSLAQVSLPKAAMIVVTNCPNITLLDLDVDVDVSV